MKWIVIIAFIVVGGYWMSFLQSDRRSVYVTGLLMGFLPFVVGPWHLQVAPYAIPMWSGYSKGWEVSLIDALAIAVLMSDRLKVGSTPLQWPLIIYFVAATITVPLAIYPMFAVGYSLQVLRALLAFYAVARLAAREDGARGVFTGLVVGLAFQCVLVLQARFQGALQSGGSFGHQNLLGYVSHMVLLPAFAVLIGGGRWQRVGMLGVLVGAIVVILTASRATIMVAALGIVLTYCVSAAVNWTSRKATFGMITLVLMAISVPFAQESLGRRFAAKGGQLFGEDAEREQFEKAAEMMIHDHPLGVGANHYVFVANVGGYNNKVNITWAQGSRSTNVHNSYLLVNAEMGYFGLLAFCGLLGGTIYSCISYARKFRTRGYAELIAGVGCGVFCVALHSKFEWMFVTFQAQYVIFIAIGLAAGCIIQSRRPRKRKIRRETRPEDQEDETLIAEPETQAVPS